MAADTKSDARHKLILVDLDDTLIDTSEYKKLLFTYLSNKLSIPKKRVESAYSLLRKPGLKDGWIGELIDMLCDDIVQEKERLVQESIEITKNLPVFKNVIEHVASCDGKKIILTQGDEKLQLAKVNYHQLKKYFSDIIIVNGDKVEYLKLMIGENSLKIKGETYKYVDIIDNKVNLYSGFEKYSWIKITDTNSIA
ncbi:HAD hydrolase-like protein [Candidatus Woesebacteria bacterium]|nr:HAD hydrolase-like protein [Candidatus Woesebacteria bacterium]